MKYLSAEQQANQSKFAFKRFEKKIRRRQSKHDRQLYVSKIKRQYRNKISSLIDCDDEYIPILVPNHLSLKNNPEVTVGFLNEIRDLVLSQKLPVMLIFDEVEKMGASAALAFAAEIHRCRHLRRFRNKHSISGNYPKSETVAHLLKAMGFFKSINVIDPSTEMDSANDVLHVQFQSFTNVDSPSISTFAKKLLEAFPHLTDMAKGRMKGSVVEAISNTFDHAFRAPPMYPLLGQRSWLGGVVDRSIGQFTLMVFDQGAGIPGTLGLVLRDRLVAIKALRADPSESELIHAATKLKRTSTGQGGRGKGFETMRRFVQACDDGELRVFSGRGQFLYTPSQEVVSSDCSTSLGGTLILWRVRHEQAELEV